MNGVKYFPNVLKLFFFYCFGFLLEFCFFLISLSWKVKRADFEEYVIINSLLRPNTIHYQVLSIVSLEVSYGGKKD